MGNLLVKILDEEGPHIYIRFASELDDEQKFIISKSIDVTNELNLNCDQTVRIDLDENGSILSIEIF